MFLQLAELHAAASEPRQVAAQDREPCVEKRVIYVVETITPSRVEEIGRILSRSRRPDPDIRIEKKPVLAVDPSYRDAGCFSPMDSLRVRMIFIDRCEEAGNLARDFAHYVLQSGEWRLVRVVRVGDKIRAGFGGTGSSFSPRSRLCRIAARKSRSVRHSSNAASRSVGSKKFHAPSNPTRASSKVGAAPCRCWLGSTPG